MSVHQKPDGRWYVSWRDGGKQRTKTFGRGPEAEAKAREFSSNRDKTFGALLEDFLKTKSTEGKSKVYLDAVQMVGGVIDPSLSLRRLTYETVREALSAFAAKSAITRNRYISYLKVVFNYGVKRGWTDHNPLAQWQKRREQPRCARLSFEDLNRIYNAAPPHLKWVIKVVANLGVRPGRSEAFRLRWEDIDWENNTIVVWSTKTTATSAYRIVPFSEEFAEELRSAHQKATTPFLCEYKGKPITHVRKSLRAAVVKAGVAYRCCLYDVRHLYATTLLRGGADVKTVSELLGHKSARMTLDVYHHTFWEDKRRAIRALPGVG